MWELTEKACKLYLARMKRDRCYGKKKTGIEKMEKELHCRVSGQKLVEDAESGYKDVRSCSISLLLARREKTGRFRN